jgi:hypothetical protein
MNLREKIILNILLLIAVVGTISAQSKKAFNGKNLEGWVIPENNIWWHVDKGILEAKSDPEQKGSILWTEMEYENFIIELDFKFGEGTVDSGVFIRTVKEQIQIGQSGSLKRDMTASPYIAKKGYPVEAKNVKELLKTDDWNRLKIKAEGNRYTAWLDGNKVMTYESETAVEKGPIGLQLHPDRDMEISFKKIKIGVLD